MSNEKQREILKAALSNPDWGQVVSNGGPPCFHIMACGKFCFRTDRWGGHPTDHTFVSLADFVQSDFAQLKRITKKLIIELDIDASDAMNDLLERREKLLADLSGICVALKELRRTP